ncbi:hypothetical protein ACXA45_02935 [Neomicrococcus lactis]
MPATLPPNSKRPASTEELLANAARMRNTIMLVLAASLLTMLPLPWKFLTIPVGIAAIIAGIVALKTSLRIPGTGFVNFTIILALVGCLLFTASVTLQGIFFQPTMDYQRCIEESLTSRSLEQCSRDFNTSLMDQVLGRN